MYNFKTGLYEGYIYLITNNINNKKYVGQTIKTIDRRFKEHCSREDSDMRYIDRAINKYGFESFSVEQVEKVICINKESTREVLNILEKYYIKKFNTLKPNGYNVDTGGNMDVYCGVKIDAYDLNGILLKTFDSIKDASNYYHTSTDSVRKISNGEKTRVRTLDVIFRFHGDSFDKYPIELGSLYKQIYKFTPTGDLVGVFDNMELAAMSVRDKYPKASREGIRYYVANDFNGLIYGYYWSYENVFKYKRAKLKHGRYVAVDQYSLDGEYIRSYDSIAEACRSLNNFSYSATTAITNVCRGCAKTSHGYIWRYKDDPFEKEFKNAV